MSINLVKPESLGRFVAVVGGASDPYASYTAYDAMLGANGASITARSPEKGGPWTAVSSNLLTNGSGQSANSTGSISELTIPGLADGYFVAVGRNLTATQTNHAWLLFNYLDASNWWAWGFYFNFMRLTRCVATVETEIYASATVFGTTNHTFKVRRNGNSIECYYDGTLMHTASDATHKTNTVCGLRNLRNGVGNYVEWDTFTVASTDI